jgi:hypothetical protein
MNRRMQREARTMAAMIAVSCRRSRHAAPRPCPECRELLDYALGRLEKCPFADEKPTCANCTVHCYRPDMRARVRVMMRTAGPHMVYRHPYLALMHLLVDARRTAPALPSARAKRGAKASGGE